jgi:hypothetical protein
MKELGAFLVSVLLIVLGIFLMVAAYARTPILLRLASLGMFRINPDSPGRIPRLIMFCIGVTLCVVGLILVVVDKLHDLGVF